MIFTEGSCRRGSIDAVIYRAVVSRLPRVPDLNQRYQLRLDNSTDLTGFLHLDEPEPTRLHLDGPRSTQNYTEKADRALEFYAVLLSHNDGPASRLSFYFLLLEPAAEPNSYRRVGIFDAVDVDSTCSEARSFQNARGSSRILLV